MTWIKRMFLGPDADKSSLWLSRRETWAGDVKSNRIRMAGIAVFAANELVNFHLLHVVDLRFHVGSLLIIILWVMAAAFFRDALRRHLWPRAMPFLIPSVDLFLLTWLLFLADGPQSPLVSVYFLIIALSALRLDPAVALYTAGAAAFGYLSVLQFMKVQNPALLVPPHHAVIVTIAILFMGAIASHAAGRVLALIGELSRQPKDRP